MSSARSDSFLTRSFTSSEVAYCALQPDPAQHLATRFCAKEALRKCSPIYATIELDRIEVIRENDETPSPRVVEAGASSMVDAVVSLSHTAEIAVAVVVLRDRRP